jgi:hypothetical protein
MAIELDALYAYGWLLNEMVLLPGTCRWDLGR